MAIEFSIDREDLMHALKPFFGARKHAKSAALDCVDIKAQENEVEFITAGFSSSVKAEVGLGPKPETASLDSSFIEWGESHESVSKDVYERVQGRRRAAA